MRTEYTLCLGETVTSYKLLTRVRAHKDRLFICSFVSTATTASLHQNMKL
jgi:hypothetical protein